MIIIKNEEKQSVVLSQYNGAQTKSSFRPIYINAIFNSKCLSKKCIMFCKNVIQYVYIIYKSSGLPLIILQI